MSKYEPLWIWIRDCGEGRIELSFDEIEHITGFPIDHSFLSFKKELGAYGRRVGRISMKEKTVIFEKGEE